MVKKILVPIDGSIESDKALTRAREIAEKDGAEMVLYHVAERRPIPIKNYPFSDYPLGWLRGVTGYNSPSLYPTWAEEFDTKYEAHLEDYFHQALKKVNEEKTDKVKTSLVVEAGDPVDRILDKSKDENFDLIVMGSTGLGSVDRFLFGSVSNGVKTHSKIPVKLYNKEGKEVK